MTDSRLRLVLALHDHQPVGNFDGVFEDAYRDSYEPFLDTFEQFPELAISLHTSGSLLEWLVERKPAYVDRVRTLVQAGRVEVLGGPFFEPILASIPQRDRVGQIREYSRYLKDLFGTRVRGMWLPERVWEQQFCRDIADAGIEYTILDDYHFRAAGLRDHELTGQFLTEDEGRVLGLFPGDEHLRYLIPFRPVREVLDHLRRLAHERRGAVVVFGDDGEKFGTWPGTKEAVYGKGWLREFLTALRDNGDWLHTTTLAEAADHVPPVGDTYVPDCSYREMTEWSLPTPRQTELHDLVEANERGDLWPKLKPFLRGGYWRNFRSKYREAREMYARMLEVSDRLATAGEDATADRPLVDRARTELHRAQCNCPYWHGAFGGLYLPHLRNAIFKHLIRADSLLERATGKAGPWCGIAAKDYDLDARKEVRLANDRLVAYLKPTRGGHLYGLDVRGADHNLLATLDRRPEPYHKKILEAAIQPDPHAHHEGDSSHGSPHPPEGADRGEDAVSIHDLVHFKQPDLDKKIAYDRWPTKSLVDHFLRPGLSREEFRRAEGELGDFAEGVYETVLRRSDTRVEAVMTRTAHLNKFDVRVRKTAALNAGSGSLEVRYDLADLPPGLPVHFAVALHFAGLAGSADDRYFYDTNGGRLGRLSETLDLPETDRLGMVDEWLGLHAGVEVSEPAAFWTYPVETVSGSESGFELVFQSAAVVPHWEFTVPDDGRWGVNLTIATDASAAQAKMLAELELVGAA